MTKIGKTVEEIKAMGFHLSDKDYEYEDGTIVDLYYFPLTDEYLSVQNGIVIIEE